jgi:methionine-rich copper-binding protein CopC
MNHPTARNRHQQGRNGVAVVLLAVAVQLGVAVPAHAHAQLTTTSPALSSIVKVAPRQISVSFNEPVTVAAGGVQLLNSTGTILSKSAAESGPTITMTAPKLRNGRYVVRWRIVSADGHPVTASYSFAVGTPTPAAKPLSGYLSDRTGDITFNLNGNRAGVRTAVVGLKGVEGTLEWKHPKFGAPMVWDLTATGNAMSAVGMIPAAGTWTVTARVRVGEFEERILIGKIEVKA